MEQELTISQSSEPECQIHVQADGLQSKEHFLEQVRRDAKLSLSLMTQKAADRTGARPKELEDVITVADELGMQYNCKTMITLQWRLSANVAYRREDFYIVTELPGDYDAYLRRTIALVVATANSAHPAWPTELSRQKHG